MVAFLVAIILTPFAMLWRGFVASIMWGWFMVPLFDLPPLGVWASYGVIMVASMFVPTGSGGSSDDSKDQSAAYIVGMAAAKAVLVPLIVLVVGAWVHSLAF